MCGGLHVKYRYFCQILMKFEFSRQFFEKYSNIKFRENPSEGTELFRADRRTDGRTDITNRVVPCGQTDGRTDITKLIVAFRNFENALKKRA